LQYSCDVIIPVYKGYEEVKECVESVLLNCGEELNKIILVNDCSPFPDIQDYFKELILQDNQRISIVQNDKNLGYLKTCNKAMELSAADVVLLNSDTVTTRGWLKKMLDCAYSRPNIATVTPFTNNGILCSLPNIERDNDIPFGMHVDEYAALIEQISKKEYPLLPSGFGFCMLVKRSVINEIGLLDEVYGKGYYEENDFCCRARVAGYDNVLCDDTYIYHKGSVSFCNDKYDISKNNKEIILSRYPDIISEIRNFMKNGILSDIHLKIMLHAMLWSSKKSTVFFMLHKTPFDDTTHRRGGVEYHVLDMIDILDDFNYCVFYPVGDGLIVNAYILKGRVDDQIIEIEFDLKKPLYKEQQYSSEVYKLLDQIITGIRVSCVHVQHLLGHTLDIFDICKNRKIPCYITLHDYFVLCPNFTLLDNSGAYCGAADDVRNCDSSRCSKGNAEVWKLFIERYRNTMHSMLKASDRVLVPSRFLKNAVERWYPDITCDVVEHIYEIQELDANKEEYLPAKGRKLKVAFLGAVSKLKGSALLMELMGEKTHDVEWHVFGSIGDLDVRTCETQENVFFHGSYKRELIISDLRKNNIDIVCLLSKWPETYGYTLTEAWMAGCPVICTNYGAIAQRVREKGAGWVLKDEAQAKDVMRILESVIKQPAMLKEAQERIPPFGPEEMQKIADIYLALYRSNPLDKPERLNQYDPDLLSAAWKKTGIYDMFFRRNKTQVLSGMVLSSMYLDRGEGFNEDDCIRNNIPLQELFDIRFDVKERCLYQGIRFDIAEGFRCMVKINTVQIVYADGEIKPLDMQVHNGSDEGEWVVFDHKDPYFIWSIDAKPVVYIRIAGEWKILNDASMKNTIEMVGYHVQPGKVPTRIYYNNGNGYNENDSIKSMLDMPSIGTLVTIEMEQPVYSVRWDPMELKGCAIKINEMKIKTATENLIDYPVDQLVHNGNRKGKWIIFDSADPWIDIKAIDGKLILGAVLSVEIVRNNESKPKIAQRIRSVSGKIKRKIKS